MNARLATEIGTRISLRIYWGDDCPNCIGGGSKGYHNATKQVKDISEKLNDNHFGGEPEDYADDQWPIACDHCGAIIPMENFSRQVSNNRLYDTPSGALEPGCLFWNTWLPENFYWDNHTGPHLSAVLPNGREWNIDARASNCGSPNDRTHRCWCRHGEPPNVTVDKRVNSFQTCVAGAGSIQVDDWHGFLREGKFVL